MFTSRLSLIVFAIQLISANLIFAYEASAQMNVRIHTNVSNTTIKHVFDIIESKTTFTFIYDSNNIDVNRSIVIDNNQTVKQILNDLEETLNLSFKPINNTITVVKSPNTRLSSENLTKAVKKISNVSNSDSNIGNENLQLNIVGTITDVTGELLPGVSVQVKGSTIGAATDINGAYNLNASGTDALVFTYIGFTTQEIAVNNRTTINVQLIEDSQSLDEVVVVGYGTVKKSDITGSVGSVSGEDLTSYPVADAVMGLQGKTAGVQVMQNSGTPGGTISVRIRGGNSLQGDNEPLYVVDGFALSETPNAINPNDIESIEVLKDASATAIYGSRGANGVVLITTKQGKTGTTRVDINSYYAIQEVGKTIDLLNAKEFAELINERTTNDGFPAYFTQDEVNSFSEGTNWQDVIFRKAPMQNHSITVSGGSPTTQFSISGSYLGQDGIIVGSNIQRESLRANVTQAINDKIKLNYNAILTNTDNSQLRSDNGQKGGTVLTGVLVAPPTIAPKNPDGTYSNVQPYTFSPNELLNPLALALEREQQSNDKSILAGTSITYEPISNLIFRSSVGIESRFGRNNTYSPSILANTPTGSADISSFERTNILNENTVTYNKEINDVHDFTLLGGITYQQNTSKNFGTGNVTGFSTDELGFNNLQSGSVPGNPTSGTSKWVLFSYLGRVNYSYKGTYLLTASLRADGSSRFGEGNKWGYFPSAAFAWRVINEPFAESLDFLSDLKVRLTYGITGSTALSPYQTLNTLNSYSIVYDDQRYTGYGPSLTQLANPFLKWETTAQSDIGLDIGFIKNRLYLTFDYYRKDTKDLLENVPMPTSSGYSSTIRNIGKIRNTGIELGLNAKILDRAFKWDMNVNFSKNKSEVTELADGSDVFGVNVPQPLSAPVNLVRVGQPVGVFYGYIEDGLDAQGAIKYKDLDGNGSITLDDRTIIGDPNPDFLYNFSSNMSYKNFQLDWAFQGKQGGDLFNVNLSSQGNSIYFGENQLKEVYDNHWSVSNPDPNAKYPKLSANAKFRESDRYVEDGSFLRLKNVQLAYKIPLKSNSLKWIKGLQIYASGQNLLTFTKYSWYDPEVNTRGGANSISIGIDNSGYPNAKTYTFGARINL